MVKDLINNIDFKKLSKNCKDEKNLSNLTKEFMKNMIEKMLESEIEEFQKKSVLKNVDRSKVLNKQQGEVINFEFVKDRTKGWKI
jgi:putative transposase